jgi:hyperosmotically inducible periplasmic protein
MFLRAYWKITVIPGVLTVIAMPAIAYPADLSGGDVPGSRDLRDAQSRALAPADKTDPTMTQRVKAQLARDKDINATNIAVDSDDRGTVRLTGQAGSQREADRAVTIARGVEGVTTVQNNIHVTSRR